ncbi:hypothetical protein [Kineococcus esterisolvens]|uniref:hypothetical protein n=1 Tax=unclassified Kineococcus TaxID=2621656 RepID=UPI003D7EF057
MDEQGTTDSLSPQDALAAVRAGRESAAARVASIPWWYHALAALPLGGLLASQALSDGTVRIITVLAIVPCLTLVGALYSRALGGDVDGFRRGRTRPLAWSTLVLVIALALGTVVTASALDSGAVYVAGGLVAVVVGTAYGVVWSRVYAAEMRSGL